MIDSLLEISLGETINKDFAVEQQKDGDINMLTDYLRRGMLPEDR